MYGKGLGSIWLDEVDCFGFELSIGECKYSGWGFYDCRYSEDVFIICLLNGEDIFFNNLLVKFIVYEKIYNFICVYL